MYLEDDTMLYMLHFFPPTDVIRLRCVNHRFKEMSDMLIRFHLEKTTKLYLNACGYHVNIVPMKVIHQYLRSISKNYSRPLYKCYFCHQLNTSIGECMFCKRKPVRLRYAFYGPTIVLAMCVAIKLLR